MVFRSTFDPLTRYVARRVRVAADVADIVASTYVEALTDWARYDAQRGEPISWLIGIARNLVAHDAKRHRKQGALAQRICGRELLAPDEFDEIDAVIDAVRLAPRVEQALNAVLTDHERELLVLVREDGLSLADAARALGITPVAARMRLARARRRVQQHLDNQEDAPEPGGRPATAPSTDRYV